MSNPGAKYVFEKRTFQPDQKQPKHLQYIAEHYFNYSVSFVLPNTPSLPDNITKLIPGQGFSLVENVPLTLFTEQEFIDAFVSRGHVYMLSQDTLIDVHDCVALLPSGDLILNLTRDTFAEMGIGGVPSLFHKKHKDKFVVKIPLLADYFKSGKKYYERVKWCFEKRPDLKFNFLVSWEPNDMSVSGSSLGHYLQEHQGFTNHECQLQAFRQPVEHLDVPTVTWVDSKESEQGCGFEQLMEWLGAVSCGVQCDGTADSYVNTYSCPVPNTRCKSNTVCSFKGFFTPETMETVLEALKSHLAGADPALPWVAMTVHGFHDSPVSWKFLEHGYFNSGDNFYTFVLFPDNQYWYYKGCSVDHIN